MALFTRQALYDLVWSQPIRTAAAGIGVSDVALAKACRKADIPVPNRGYWAKKRATKPTSTRALPPRFPGGHDEIEVGAGRRQYGWDPNWREKLLTEPLPPVPTFDEHIAVVAERVRKMVGKVPCPYHVTNPHRLIATLLERDEKRREEYVRTGYSWYAPLYDSPLEKRRTRILNAIFVTVQRLGCRPYMNTSQYAQERDTSIRVGDETVPFSLEPKNSKPRTELDTAKVRFRLTIASLAKAWEDTDQQRLESMLSEIVVEIIVTGERSYRQRRLDHREWLVKRKAEVEEEIRRAKAEEERKARELRAKQEKERIDRLLAEAQDLDKSNAIRVYVETVRSRAAELPMPSEDLERWTAWALNEADRIDPLKNGAIVGAVDALPKLSSD